MVETYLPYVTRHPQHGVQITPEVKVSGYRWGRKRNRLSISFYISVIGIGIFGCLAQKIVDLI
jgi:hypothetical protein